MLILKLIKLNHFKKSFALKKVTKNQLFAKKSCVKLFFVRKTCVK